jgi:predicted nucleic acid-binding protein
MVVQLELAKWLTREADEDNADQRSHSPGRVCGERVVVPLDTRLALAAVEVSARHKLATEAIIYGAAQAHGADILTCDADFEELPGSCSLRRPAPEARSWQCPAGLMMFNWQESTPPP